jgi:alanine racemase
MHVNALRSATHAVVDLDAYTSNIATLRSLAPVGAQFMAVLKADAYGHGAVGCGVAAQEAGVEWLGVARIAEARQLRNAGVTCRILIIGPPNVGEVEDAARLDIDLAVGSESSLDALLAAASSARQQLRVHVKVETGMHRFGFTPESTPAVIDRLSAHNNIAVEGVYTHFSCADESDPRATDEQNAMLDRLIEQLDARGMRPPFIHRANSAAVISGRAGASNLVRCGIATLGLSPSEDVPVDSRFRPVLSLHSTVARVATLPAGGTVSYGGSYRANSNEPIATIPVGYADGIPRQLANQGWFVIDGVRRPIRGRVCMDQTIVGLASGVREGATVAIYGAGDGGEMSLDEIARIAGTNNYEIATRVTARVPRLYVRGGEVVAWDHRMLGTFERLT